MKQLLYIGLILFLCASNGLAASFADDPFVLVLDAGHGGTDSGAVGKKAKEKEKTINLAVTLLAGKYISERHPDVKVLYTRKDDSFVGLQERADYANKSQANLFISIHANAVKNTSARGLEVYALGDWRAADNLEVMKRENSVIYLEENYKEKYEGFDPNSPESYIAFELLHNKFWEQSLGFAETMCDEMKSCAPWNDRGVKQAGFLLLRGAGMPSILIELDFVSNFEAEALMMSVTGQKKYAQAICNAFSRYKASYDRRNSIKSATYLPLPEKETPANDPAPDRQVYKVQLFAIPRALPANSPHLKGYKADYYVENKMYKYTYGESEDWEEISQIRKSLLKDFKDAFIVAFENGIKVQVKRSP